MSQSADEYVELRDLDQDLQQLVEVDPRFFGSLVRVHGVEKTASGMVQMRDYLVKKGDWTPVLSMGQTGKNILGTATALALAGTAANLIGGGIDKGLAYAADKLTFDRDLERIKRVDPQIVKDIPDENRLRLLYQTVRRFAPEMSKDPVVAASVLRRLGDYRGTVDHSIVNQLVQAEKGLAATMQAGTFGQMGSEMSGSMMSQFGKNVAGNLYMDPATRNKIEQQKGQGGQGQGGQGNP